MLPVLLNGGAFRADALMEAIRLPIGGVIGAGPGGPARHVSVPVLSVPTGGPQC